MIKISLYIPLLYGAAEFFYEKVHGKVTLFVVVVGYTSTILRRLFVRRKRDGMTGR